MMVEDNPGFPGLRRRLEFRRFQNASHQDHDYVKPVFEHGVANDPNNCRPISLTSTCCRVMERIINYELLDDPLDNHLIIVRSGMVLLDVGSLVVICLNAYKMI